MLSGNVPGTVRAYVVVMREAQRAAAASYALLAYRLGHRLPFGAVALLLEYSWAPASVLLGLAILLFPDGRLPSPRWRPVLWSYLAVIACYAEHVCGRGYRPCRAPCPRRLGRGPHGHCRRPPSTG